MEKPDFTNLEKNTVTNRQVMNMVADLLAVSGIRGLKINSAVVTTVENLKPYVNKMQQEKLIPVPDKINEYREEVRKLFEELSKDANGVPRKKIIGEGQNQQEVFDVDSSNPEVIRLSSELDEKYKEHIDAYNNEIKEYNEFMRQEFPIDIEPLIVRIEAKILPSDISTENFVRLRHILKTTNIE